MTDLRSFFIHSDNQADVESNLQEVLSLVLNFKNRKQVSHHRTIESLMDKYLTNLPQRGCDARELVPILREMLDESINWSSPMFMGFNDSANSIAGLMGSLIESTCQQNLINSDFCARSATFVEVCTVRWLRELAGYQNVLRPKSVQELGGVATTGGTCSNMYGLLMARKNAYPDSFQNGIPHGARPKILVASDITHYSVAAAAGLVGFGTSSLVKVPTKNFSMDLQALEASIKECKDKGEDVVCIVANAGDSRTLTMDHLGKIVKIKESLAPKSWLHVDACNGGQLLFSKKHRVKISGIEGADSIALDPHKVFNVPYALSYFLFRDPAQADGFWSSSSLIMRDPWALGQLTPNIGSKTWSSLKLYLFMKHMGMDRLQRLIDNRIELADRLRDMLEKDGNFRLVTDHSDMNSVPFIFIGKSNPDKIDPKTIYSINEKIYARMLQEGTFYVHGFSIKDDGNCLNHGPGTMLFVLRYMSSNPFVGNGELTELIHHLSRIGEGVSHEFDLQS